MEAVYLSLRSLVPITAASLVESISSVDPGVGGNVLDLQALNWPTQSRRGLPGPGYPLNASVFVKFDSISLNISRPWRVHREKCKF